MTQPIETMTPAELNAAVAREVMGWTVPTINQHCWIVRDADGRFVEYRELIHWNPAESIADAFEVVARMRELGFSFQIEDGFPDDAGTYYAVFIKLDEREPIGNRITAGYGDNDLPALAITRAALAAVRALRAGREGVV